MWKLHKSRILEALSYWGRVWRRLKKGDTLYDSVMQIEYRWHRPDGLVCGTFLSGRKPTEGDSVLLPASGEDRDDVPLK